jgi:hypothetical protein
MVTWWQYDGNDHEIFFYDGSQTIQLTNNDREDWFPQTHNGMVTWYGFDDDPYGTEIFLWDGTQTIQLTESPSLSSKFPQIHNGMVTWYGSDGNDNQIFLYDGTQTIQLTYTTYPDIFPQIHNGMVTWEAYTGDNYDVFFYDGSQTSKIPSPWISNDMDPQIHNGMVTWRGYDGEDTEIFLWDGTQTIKLTNNDNSDTDPQIHNGMVTWYGSDGEDNEIFLYDGTQVIQLTDNNVRDEAPQIHNGEVVFDHDVNDILVARIDTTPPIIQGPEDLTIESGQYFELSWDVSDPETEQGTYEILFGRVSDGQPTIPAGDGYWDPDNPVETFRLLREWEELLTISETEAFVAKLTVYSGLSSSDEVIITFTPDITPPTFTPHEDIIVEAEQGLWDMTWLAHEFFSVSYEVTIDGVFHDSATIPGMDSFHSTGPILPAGEYTVECTFTDSSGNSASDTIAVTVLLDTFPPIISDAQDIYMLEGDLEVIEWNVIETRPSTYEISQDSVVVETGIFTDLITYDLSHLSSGLYEIVCTAYDLDGNSASDTVLVIVSGYLHWIFDPVDQILIYGEALDYQIAVHSTGNIREWWINDAENFRLATSYSEGVSTAHVLNKTTLLSGEYEIELIVTDMNGRTLTGSFKVIVREAIPSQIQLKLSGEFDFLLKEEIRFQLAALLTDTYTGAAVSGATVTFDIYNPDGAILVSGTLVEDMTNPGVYIYVMSDTMKDLKLPKGIYLVYAQAISPDGFEAVDMIQFHIDPPGETYSTSLLYFAPIGVGVVVVLGIMIGGLLMVRKRRLSKTR